MFIMRNYNNQIFDEENKIPYLVTKTPAKTKINTKDSQVNVKI